MSFLPITTNFFATLHDATVEHFAFEPLRGRLLLTLLLDSNMGASYRLQQVVLSGIRNGADMERVQLLVKAALATNSRAKLGYRLDEFCLLPQGDLECQDGRLSVRLAIDHLPTLQFCCQKITNEEVNLA